MTTTDITWKWGSNTLVDFNPKTDVLNFGWFGGNQFDVRQDGANLIIAIPSNEQKYTLLNTKLSDLTMADIKAADPSALAKWQALLGGDPGPAPGPTPPAPDPVPPKPDPDPVPPKPDPDPIPPGPAGARYFSPYIDMGLWISRGMPSMVKAAGANAVTMGFMVGQNGTIVWGGAGVGIDGFTGIIKEAQASGIQVTISFGGASGDDPGVTYGDADSLARDLQKVIDVNGCKRLDFDIEGAASANTVANKRRAEALRKLKQANPDLFISFTLAALQSGLVAEGMSIIRQTKEAGLELDVLNIMAMDYYTGEQRMGRAAIEAASSTKHQLETLGMPNTRVGITPMVGINDSKVEIFTLDNAKEVLDFANATPWVESLGIWSLGRDNGNEPLGIVRYDVSGLPIPLYGFSQIFRAFK